MQGSHMAQGYNHCCSSPEKIKLADFTNQLTKLSSLIVMIMSLLLAKKTTGMIMVNSLDKMCMQWFASGMLLPFYSLRITRISWLVKSISGSWMLWLPMILIPKRYTRYDSCSSFSCVKIYKNQTYECLLPLNLHQMEEVSCQLIPWL